MFGDAIRVQHRAGAVDIEKLRQLAPGKKDEYLQKLAELTHGLRGRLASLHPFGVLSRVALANVMGTWGEYFEPSHKGSEAKVEFLAGLLLTQPASDAADPPPADEVQAVFDALDELVDLALLATIAQGLTESEREAASADLQVRSRMHAMHIRGDSYVQHSRDLARAIYGPLSNWMVENLGFDIEDLIKVTECIRNLMGTRVTAILEDASQVAETGAGLAMKDEAPEAMRQALQQLGPEDFRRFLVVQYVEEHLTQGVTFTQNDLLSNEGPLSAERVTAVLERLASEVGSRTDITFDSPLDENPLTATPILRLEERHMLPVAGMLGRDYHLILEREVMANRKGFSRHRARVLDDLALAYLEKMLPGSEAYSHLHYEFVEEGGRKQGELDGLVIFDNIAVVVEGKGSPLSRQSRRGDLKRLARDIERAIGDAWRQGARARDYLLNGRDADFRTERGKRIVTIPANSISKVYIVNPTLHALADHALQLPRLRHLGLFSEGEYPWSVFINDLRIISETVRNPAEFLAYLEWRSRLPLGDRVTATDELDLFGSFLLREQPEARIADGLSTLHLQSSTDFDAFYLGEEGDGPPTERPKMFSIPLIDRFIDRLAKQRPSGWVEAAGVTLELSLSELAALDSLGPDLAGSLDPADVHSVPLAEVVPQGSAFLVGIGNMRRWPEAYGQLQPELPGSCSVVFLSTDYLNKPRIVWALRHP